MIKRCIVAAILIAAILSLPAFVGLLDTQVVLVKTDSQLIGQQADAYLAQKASRNPVFARALKESEDRLAAKGWKKVPGGAMVVTRTVREAEPNFLGRVLRLFGAPVHAQYLTAGTGSGEIVFSSWDDGDNNTWEGFIAIDDYTRGDTFDLEIQFDYSASVNGTVEPTITYQGYTGWWGANGREWPYIVKNGNENPQFLASIAESICPTLDAQASDGLGCNAGARTLTRAFMKQGFLRLKDNAGWLLGGAASAGVFGGGPVGFLATLGITGGGVILDGYVGEFNRFMSRCTTR
jgi:hypothetical protein